MTGVQQNRATTTNAVSLIDTFFYRPEVDGLRAIAVLAVLIYHADLGLSGGFVGVDVFFVISGFLITSLILIDLQEQSFTLLNFYERRARRIVPALAFVVLCSLIAGGFLLFPEGYADLGWSATYQATGAANIFFWQKRFDYFAGGRVDQMPLLHTWSLAVEEQFYFFVPMGLCVICRNVKSHQRKVLFAVFITVMFLSGLASICLAAHRQATFFNLPTRAWELLIGSTLAIMPVTFRPKGRWLSDVVAYLGLAGILVPCFFYTSKTPFPGWTALPPCLGAALIIWSNSRLDGTRPTNSLGKLLATRPMVFIGLISYSLYLWHWPLFAFSKSVAIEPLTLAQRIGLVGLGLVCGTLSWRYIETPFRKKFVCRSRSGVLCFAGVSLLGCAFLGGITAYLDGLPQRFRIAFGNYFPVNPIQETRDLRHELTERDVRDGRLIRLGGSDTQKPIELFVWGDSHAMVALPAFDTLCKELQIRGQAATHSSTAPLLPEFLEAPYPINSIRSTGFSEAILSHIRDQHIPHTVLAARWDIYDKAPNASEVTLQKAILATVNELRTIGTQPWILLQVPRQPFDPNKAVVRIALLGSEERQFCANIDSWNGISGYTGEFLNELTLAGARIINPRLAFRDPSNGFYPIIRDHVLLYMDNDHLSKRGAQMMLAPVVESTFSDTFSEMSTTAENRILPRNQVGPN